MTSIVDSAREAARLIRSVSKGRVLVVADRRDAFLTGVHPLDVERAQFVLDDRGDLGRQLRDLGIIVAEQQVDGRARILVECRQCRPCP